MPDPLARMWLYAANPVRPVIPDRPCGCFHDALVFGHYHVTAEGTVTW